MSALKTSLSRCLSRFALAGCLSFAALTNAHAFGIYTCTTTSGGVDFSYDSRDPSYAKQSVLQNCRYDSRTMNAECDANVACNDGLPYNPFFSCDTFSGGLNFRIDSRDPQFARQLVAQRCRADSRTLNAECDANISCNDGSVVRPIVSCDTFSGGVSFQVDSRDENYARQLVMQKCHADSRTRNQECDVNVACRGGGQFPPIPQPPIPQPPIPQPPQPPESFCPPNTHYEPSVGRCVSDAQPPIPPQPRTYTCQVTSPNGLTFTAKAPDQATAIQRVLQTCGARSGGYPCQRSQVRCY